MKKSSWVVIALAVASSTASAQPGDTPQPQPYPQPQPGGDIQGQPPPPPEGAQGPGYPLDIDALIERAHAASPTLEKIARGAFRRARRAISFGPTVGLWGGRVLAQDASEYALTFGLGLETFKVPILPTPETLKQLVMDRAKAKLREQLVARFAGQQPDPISAEQFAREVWEDAIKEVLGLENTRARTMERPAFNAALEVNRQFEAEAWTPRLRLGIGVSRITVAASFAIPLGADGYTNQPIYLGLEAVVHFMTSPNPRSSVVDVFLRGDFEMRNRGTNTDMLVLGVRYLLDII